MIADCNKRVRMPFGFDHKDLAFKDHGTRTARLTRSTDALGNGTAAGEELDCYTADGEDDGDDGSSSDRSGSYVTTCCSTSKSMTTAAAGG